MKIVKDYFWDNLMTMEHRDFFPEIDEWANENKIVQCGDLIFPVGTDFSKQGGDNYYVFFNVTLPNGNTFNNVPVNLSLIDELIDCFA